MSGTGLQAPEVMQASVGMSDDPPQKVTVPIRCGADVATRIEERRDTERPLAFVLAPGVTAREVAGPVLDTMVDDVRRRGAQALHLEPSTDHYVLRSRIDGRLGVLATVSTEIGQAIASLVAPSLDPGERTVTRTIMGRKTMLSISTLDCVEGRRIHIELNATEAAPKSLVLSGASTGTRLRLSRLLERGEGMVLICGPTGSGRHSTIATMLSHMTSRGGSVLSVGAERVVALSGLGHVQVATRDPAGISEAIRAAARQDPDAIAFDGLADRGLMELALQTAQPRPLMIARTDAGDAIGAILRLRSLRIDPFLIAASLRAVMAQRLVRRLCPECRFPVQAKSSISALLGFDPGAIVYQGAGCPACAETGFQGYIAAFELVEIDYAIRRLITDGGDESILARHAFLKSPNLGSAARALVREGATSAEEAVRLSRGDPIPA